MKPLHIITYMSIFTPEPMYTPWCTLKWVRTHCISSGKIANKIYSEVFMQLKGRQIQKQFLNSLNQQQNKHKSLQNTSCNIMPVWVKQNWDLMSQKNMTWLFPLFSFNGLVNYEDPASGFCIISHPRVPKKKNQLIRWKQSKISRLVHWKK